MPGAYRRTMPGAHVHPANDTRIRERWTHIDISSRLYLLA